MAEHLRALKILLKLKNASVPILKRDSWTAADFWDETWVKTPAKPFLVFVDESRQYSFKEANEEANRIANWATSIGIKKGDTVALMKENCPEFVLVWLGLAKIGASSALINFNLTETPLANCLKLAATASKGDGPNVIIYSPSCSDQIANVSEELKEVGDFQFYEYATGSETHAPSNTVGAEFLDDELMKHDTSEPDKRLRAGCQYDEVLFYIYTSGTTGLPKAAKFNHLRFFGAGVGFNTFMSVRKDDAIYCPLPLYHSSGGALGVSMALHKNLTFVMRKKFSASKYFKDCHDYKCTIGQYIGELCRYLLTTPPSDYDTNHNVRLLLGNGIRKDVWLAIVERFHVDQIGEFYASTEGNAAMANYKNKPGAIGYFPWLIYKLFPIELIKMDPDDEETPLRDRNGLCIKCKKGEVGQLIGLIKNDDPSRRFDGYTDKKATKKKLLSNVLKQGDLYFATGDLLMRDKMGYMYFVDRIGDTFRWKGENCSTREVEDVIKVATKGILEANVYGVRVAGKLLLYFKTIVFHDVRLILSYTNTPIIGVIVIVVNDCSN
mmetsp:Transcript_18698/g.23790  ORF Transcript_18698/g.23790 Transcript_18698/m.23790 type:complete len:552 (-) Transcript_18698:1641-3296(-)